jgi:hypothetical protein
MTEFEQSFAIFDAVVSVFEKHLTHPRWQLSNDPNDPDDDEANGWVRAARVALAEHLEERVLLRYDGDPVGVEADFEDLRDYLLWQGMVDLARSMEGEPCSCDCHERTS